jgi:hypothetical protein
MISVSLLGYFHTRSQCNISIGDRPLLCVIHFTKLFDGPFAIMDTETSFKSTWSKDLDLAVRHTGAWADTSELDSNFTLSAPANSSDQGYQIRRSSPFTSYT